MIQELSVAKIKRSLQLQTPYATDRPYQPGDSVLVWREKIVNNRIDEFIGLFIVFVFDPQSKILV